MKGHLSMKPLRTQKTLSVEFSQNWIQSHMRAAVAIGKPLILEVSTRMRWDSGQAEARWRGMQRAGATAWPLQRRISIRAERRQHPGLDWTGHVAPRMEALIGKLRV